MKIRETASCIADKTVNYFTVCAESARREFKSFFDYIKNNYLFITISCAVFLVVYSSWIAGVYPRIDNDSWINNPNTTYNWLYIGRQGGILTKKLFGLLYLNPTLATTLGYLVVCLAGLLFGYLFWRCSLRSGWACACFWLPMFLSPIFAEQFYFDSQIFEIAFAFVLAAAGVGLCLYGAFRRSYTALFLSFLAQSWAIATYQSYAFLIFAMLLFCFAMLYRKRTVCGGDVRVKEYVSALLISAIVFFAAAIIYTVTTLLWFYGSAYGDARFSWKTESFSQCIENILTHVKNGLLGEGIFYSWLYLVFAILCAGTAVLDAVRSKQKLGILNVALVVAMQFSPFLLTVLFGGIITIRAQFTYSFVFAADMLYMICRDWKIAVRSSARFNFGFVFIFLSFVALFSQINITCRLIYTDNLRSQEDVRFATMLERDLKEISSEEKPLAIIGIMRPNLNKSCVYGELIGLSMFEYCYSIEPRYVSSTWTACSVMTTMGFPFTTAGEENIYNARIYARDNDMPNYPAEGSIQDMGDYIIVKLSDDEFVNELPPENAEDPASE